jgi:hypothetical protein
MDKVKTYEVKNINVSYKEDHVVDCLIIFEETMIDDDIEDIILSMEFKNKDGSLYSYCECRQKIPLKYNLDNKYITTSLCNIRDWYYSIIADRDEYDDYFIRKDRFINFPEFDILVK